MKRVILDTNIFIIGLTAVIDSTTFLAMLEGG